MAQQIRDGLYRLRLDKFDVAFDLWPDMIPASRADKMYRALKGTSPIPKELIDYCKKNNIL